MSTEPYIPPGWRLPIGPPPEHVVDMALPPADLLTLPRNLVRHIVGYENAVNQINATRTEYENGQPVVAALRELIKHEI